MSYYPSQGSYGHHGQPVVYSSSSHHGHGHSHHGHQQPYASSSEYYGQPSGGVVYVPTHGSGRSRSRRRHHHSQSHSVPQVVSSPPVIIQSSHGSRHGGGHRHSSGHRHHYSLGERIRRFFGFAPRSNSVRYKSNHSSWGFMGHSRRQRYVDAASGAEVDRRGRPIYRV